MRQYLCDGCFEALTSHTTEVRGVPEALCVACLGEHAWQPRGWADWRSPDPATQAAMPHLQAAYLAAVDAARAHASGRARARALLRKPHEW